jgi:hypothetical protein
MSRSLFFTTASMLGIALSGAVLAHHSGAMFDRSQVVSIDGEVVEWHWANPHSWLQIRGPHDGREDVLWSFEATSTQILAKQGWRRTSLQPGNRVTVDYNPFKDGAPGGNLVRVTTPDGTVFGPPARPLPRGTE